MILSRYMLFFVIIGSLYYSPSLYQHLLVENAWHLVDFDQNDFFFAQTSSYRLIQMILGATKEFEKKAHPLPPLITTRLCHHTIYLVHAILVNLFML